MKKLAVYIIGFVVLLGGFYYFLFAGTDYYKSKLPVLSAVQPFTFTDQDGKKLANRNLEGTVYATEYFFTTCKGICPKMNANMATIFQELKKESSFAIVSHTCMPEVDSVPLLKAYRQRMIPVADTAAPAKWYFVTGSKEDLYKMARQSYNLDNEKNNSLNIKDQFIHTQFFALVDKQQRVRGVYDGLKTEEVKKLIADAHDLLNESVDPSAFNHSSFANSPN
jgi:protein SCO1